MEKFNERIRSILINDCKKSEAEIAIMSKREAFEEILAYEGIIGYSEWIINRIQDIYGVSLENSPPDDG